MIDGNHGMEADVYDSDGTVAEAGGIAEYVGANAQEPLIFDDVPVSGSDNPVKSGGIYSTLQGKQSDLTGVPAVNTLLETDYLFLERGGTVYKILASAVVIPSGDDNIESEDGSRILTEDGNDLLADV